MNKFKTKLLIVALGVILYVIFPDETPLHGVGFCVIIASGIWMWYDVLKDS